VTDKIPSKWMAVIVQYGERGKHLCSDPDVSPNFFATEEEADKWAKEHCAYDQKAIVAILKVERLVKAAPVVFEVVNAD
jgi:hypothetical protein